MPHAERAAVVRAPLDVASGLTMGLRAPVFAVAATGLSLGGHVLAGGSSPGLGQLGLLGIGVGVVFRVLARREQTLPRLFAWVAATEAVLHVLFSAGAAHHHDSSGAGWSGPSMVAAHVVAAALVAWWLRRGEAVAWRAARRFFRCCQLLAVWVPPTAGPRPVLHARRVVGLAQSLVALGADPRRGPPLFA